MFPPTLAGEALFRAIEPARGLRGQETEARSPEKPRRKLCSRTHGLQEVYQRRQGQGKKVRYDMIVPLHFH